MGQFVSYSAGGGGGGGGGSVNSVTASSPLASSGGTDPNITITDAAADGVTKGAATFLAADFNASSGLISIDYTNGQAASGSTKGFLTAADWTTFNSKLSGSLTNAHIYVGNGSNVPTDVAVSGDLTLANTGAFTIANNAITNAKVDAAAAIARSKLAAGTANQVVINDGSGVLSGLTLTSGQLVIGSTGAAPASASLTGTANQITVTPGAGSITLSTPQDIATSSSPSFAGATFTADVTLADQHSLKFREAVANGTNAVILKAASNMPLDYTLIWPDAQSTSGQVLQNDGAGNLYWGSGAPGGNTNIGDLIGSGTNTSILFLGTSGVLSQDPTNFSWNGADTKLLVQNTQATGATAIFRKTTSASETGVGAVYGQTTVTSATNDFIWGVRGDAISGVNGGKLYGTMTSLTNTNTSTVGFGHYIFAPGNSGSFTTYYGLYIEGPSPGTVSGNNFALFVDSGISRFDGTIRNTVLSTGVVHSDSSGNFSSSAIVNADVDSAAAIAVTKLAALTASKAVKTDASGFLASSTASAASLDALSGTNTGDQTITLTGDVTGSGTGSFAATIASGAVTNAKVATGIDAVKLADGSVSNTEFQFLDGVTSSIQTQINAKQSSTLTSAHLLVGNGSNVATDVAVTGDLTLANTGAFTIANSAITNAKVSASAAIDFSKLAALTSAHILVGSAGNVATDVAVTGDVTISNAGVTAIGSAKVTNAMLAGSIDLTTKVTGVLPIANGGTNSTATATSGGVGYGTGTAHAYSSAGTSGDWVLSGGTGSPTISSTVTTGKFVDGSADEIQMRVQGHSTQTSTIVSVEKSDATSLLAVTNTAGTKIRGTTTNDSAAAGFVGEYIESVISSATNFPTSGTYGDLTSISLTAGDWDVSASLDSQKNGATQTIFFVGISTTSGNSTTGLTAGSNFFSFAGATASGDNSGFVPVYRISLSATTTVYLKYFSSYTVATPQAVGRLSARRIR